MGQFTLVLPSWTLRLARQDYAGADPDGFLPRDEVVGYLQQYAAAAVSPVHEGVDVLSLAAHDSHFVLESSLGAFRAREVVVATGGYQRPHRPAGVQELEPLLSVVDAAEYRNPDQLPPGRVLVVGSGQSGCQIAEELHLAGRDVVLVCGRVPWQPRRIEGRDTIWWVANSRLMRMTLADLPSPMARFLANPQASGVDGGHDLHYRTLQALGVTLTGHLLGMREGQLAFAADLRDSVEFGDARYRDLRNFVAETATERGLPVPELPAPPPFEATALTHIGASDLGVAVNAAGYRPDYTSWIDIPGAFDEMGYPLQTDGSSTTVAGLHFLGVPFQRNRASATLYGVGRDAEVLGARLDRHAGEGRPV